MSAVVSDITPVLPGRVHATARASAPWRTTSAAAIKLLGLAEGDIVDPVRLAGQLDACEQQAVRERALALLGYRERSEKELRHKLAQDGYADDAIDDVVEAFVRTGLVDDQRLADALARSAAGTKALGRRRAARVLAERGIGGDAAAVVLDRYLPEGHELPRAVELAKRPTGRENRLSGSPLGWPAKDSTPQPHSRLPVRPLRMPVHRPATTGSSRRHSASEMVFCGPGSL